VRISFANALSDEVRSAVVPPPLCKTCRWCRPVWGCLALPVFWPFPIFWHGFWEQAKSLHPTSVDRPPADYVTGRREKLRRMYCNTLAVITTSAVAAGTLLGSAALSGMGLEDRVHGSRSGLNHRLHRVIALGSTPDPTVSVTVRPAESFVRTRYRGSDCRLAARKGKRSPSGTPSYAATRARPADSGHPAGSDYEPQWV
jgi:hypothetical protein